MKDPYLYDDTDVLRNILGIKDKEELMLAESEISNYAILSIYEQELVEFNIDGLNEIHLTIFGKLYDWAGEYRSIHMIKSESVLGGESVLYSTPRNIKKELRGIMKEIGKLKRVKDEKEQVFRLVRIISRIWEIHPYRDGNTRTVMVFATLVGRSLGLSVNHEVFSNNPMYVRNALVWSAQGIYSKLEYLEIIFYDAMLSESTYVEESLGSEEKYQMIGDYKLSDYVESPHIYVKNDYFI